MVVKSIYFATAKYLTVLLDDADQGEFYVVIFLRFPPKVFQLIRRKKN